MINNRQGGRRRGRGGQRPQGMSGNSGNNARDNRQRGNAAQLLEKYKNLARDMQLAGDRVQTEYYLQFADHYFRVLEDSRSRYEDQQQTQRRRGRDEDDDDLDGDEEMMADGGDDGDDEVEAAPRPQQRPRQQQREQRDERPTREPREQRDRNRDRPDRQRANGSDRPEASEVQDERISLGVLPPAIGATDSADGGEVEAPRPRRRAVRKPRTEDGDATPAD